MNTNNVISIVGAANLTGKEYYLVKLTSTGVDLIASTDTVGVLGTIVRAMPYQEDGVYAGKSVAVQLRHGSIHYAILGTATAAVAIGSGLILDSSNPGQLIPSESSPIARSVQTISSQALSGIVIQIVFL